MRPEGPALRRDVTFWRERQANEKTEVIAFPEEELQRIASAYDSIVPNEGTKKYSFGRVFSSTTC